MKEVNWKLVADSLVEKADRKIIESKAIQHGLTKSLILEFAGLELDLAYALYKGLGVK